MRRRQQPARCCCYPMMGSYGPACFLSSRRCRQKGVAEAEHKGSEKLIGLKRVPRRDNQKAAAKQRRREAPPPPDTSPSFHSTLRLCAVLVSLKTATCLPGVARVRGEMRGSLLTVAVAAACAAARRTTAAANRANPTASAPSAVATTTQLFTSDEGEDGPRRRQQLARWPRGGGGGGGEPAALKESWLSTVALRIKQHSSPAGNGKTAWRAYETRKSELTRNPDDARLQLETAEALLKWIRHTTNGNFPRVSAEGTVCDGDSPASRAIWRKHAPEALRLLKTGASYALDGGTNGGFDLAKVREWGGGGGKKQEAEIYSSSRSRLVLGSVFVGGGEARASIENVICCSYS